MPAPGANSPGGAVQTCLAEMPAPGANSPGGAVQTCLAEMPAPGANSPGGAVQTCLAETPAPGANSPGGAVQTCLSETPAPGACQPKGAVPSPPSTPPAPARQARGRDVCARVVEGRFSAVVGGPRPPACRSARSRASSRPRFQEGARSQAPRIPQPVDFRAGRRQRTRGACRSRLLYVAKQRDGLRVLQNSVQAALGAPSKLGAFCRAALRPGPPVDHSINRDASMETPVPACPLAQGGPGPGLSSLLPCPPPPLPAERPLPTRGTAACRRRLQVQRVIDRWLSVAVCTLNYEHLGRPSSFEKHRQVCSAGKSATPAQAKALRALKGRIARHVRLVSRQTLSAASGRSAGPILNSLVEVASQSYERDVGRAAADTRLEAGFAGTNRSGRVTRLEAGFAGTNRSGRVT